MSAILSRLKAPISPLFAQIFISVLYAAYLVYLHCGII
jgi:hypothetical protein